MIWRTLAEPTYGVSQSHEPGTVAQLDAGLMVRILGSEGDGVDLAAISLLGTAGDTTYWYVTASALRFEPIDADARIAMRVAELNDLDARRRLTQAEREELAQLTYRGPVPRRVARSDEVPF